MTNNQIALIKEALLEEDLREMAIIDALPDEEFVFSEKYKKEMQKLLIKHKKYTHTANRFIPKRLVGVLVAILITLTLMMSISAIREPVVKYLPAHHFNSCIASSVLVSLLSEMSIINFLKLVCATSSRPLYITPLTLFI